MQIPGGGKIIKPNIWITLVSITTCRSAPDGFALNFSGS